MRLRKQNVQLNKCKRPNWSPGDLSGPTTDVNARMNVMAIEHTERLSHSVSTRTTVSQRSVLQLCKARDLLAQLGSPHVCIGDAAREAGLSPFHFIRRFAAVFGQTPHQFRTRERLVAAQRLLARGHTVTDVCLEIGFSSLGSFSTLFTRELGVSPAAYQRSVRRSMHFVDWVPHPPNCLLWIGGPDAIAIFEKNFRSR